MPAKQTIHVFDVDGTITASDSFILLLKYFQPSAVKRLGMWLTVSPILLKGIFTGNQSATKLALLSILWKGQHQEVIEKQCLDFFNKKLKEDLKLKAFKHIMQLKAEKPGEKMVLLSASCHEWLMHLAAFFEADFICTQLQYDAAGIFTGQYATPNCKGKEKLRRLLEKYPAEHFEFICYGNTPGDKELRSISKEFYYRYF